MPFEYNSFNQEFLGDVDVSGNILSGGINLLDIFSTSGGGGSNVSGLSSNWQTTYSTVSALSSNWQAASSRVSSLSFNNINLNLSITGSNIVSLSVFKFIEKSPTFLYSSANTLTGIDYSLNNTKRFSYVSGLLSQQIYTRDGVVTTYTYNYSNTNTLTSISQIEIFI